LRSLLPHDGSPIALWPFLTGREITLPGRSALQRLIDGQYSSIDQFPTVYAILFIFGLGVFYVPPAILLTIKFH